MPIVKNDTLLKKMKNFVSNLAYTLKKSALFNTGLLASMVFLFIVCSSSNPKDRSQTNLPPPSLSGDLRVHDPVMIKEDNRYYIFHTGRGVSIKTSPDRYHWKKGGSVFAEDALPAWHKEDIPEQNGHLWAPDIHYRNGKYHLYYSVSAWMNFNSSIGYATNTTLNSSDPDYNWVDEGKVISYKNGGRV